jgi:hypothetical protein
MVPRVLLKNLHGEPLVGLYGHLSRDGKEIVTVSHPHCNSKDCCLLKANLHQGG